MSAEMRESLGITHILSVCPNFPSTGPNHLQISVLDTEHENLLIHFPKACQFIQNSLDGGGRVLVHCVMGVSRSPAVVSAYCESLVLLYYLRFVPGLSCMVNQNVK
jgi:dual specificity phosphatase 12